MNQTATPAITSASASEVAVTRLDGTTETVTVRVIPISQVEDYLAKLGNIVPFVELACAKPSGWASSLDDDSVYKIDELARALNEERAVRWIKRQYQVANAMIPAARTVAALDNLMLRSSAGA